jgi:predicted HicB family RNase H-like nuclease
MNAHSYNITIRQVEVDGEELFEARIRELPDVLEFGETWIEAYELALDTIETTAEIMAELGRTMPPPAPVEDDYSGRVTLRVPKALHRSIAGQAEEEGISLNQYLVALLAYHVGSSFTKRSDTEPNWHQLGSGRRAAP